MGRKEEETGKYGADSEIVVISVKEQFKTQLKQ